MTQEERFEKIMNVLKVERDYLTSSQICRLYVGQCASSDMNSTGQILNMLSLAGMADKVLKPRCQRSFYVAYKLKESK